MSKKYVNLTKVITGISTRWLYGIQNQLMAAHRNIV